MTDPTARGPATTAAVEGPPDGGGRAGGLRAAFGPLTGVRILVLVVAIAFTAAAVGFAVGEQRGAADPLSGTDVGFMQDMGFHHEQAIEMSLLLMAKDGIDPSLQDYAREILMEQQFELGFFNATLDREGHTTDPGPTAMEWMDGPGVPLEDMDGLASPAQLAELRDAEGAEAEALWIALMSEHHLGGLHMADHEARHGKDRTVRNLARAMVKTQHGEVIDLARARSSADLPIPEGFTDPLEDQRLSPQTWIDLVAERNAD